MPSNGSSRPSRTPESSACDPQARTLRGAGGASILAALPGEHVDLGGRRLGPTGGRSNRAAAGAEVFLQSDTHYGYTHQEQEWT